MNVRQLIFTITLCLACACPLSATAAGQQAMLVLDASGSMWGQINGKSKIEIAREVISDVLKGWNPKTRIGLIAYGHRNKGDCNDIETLIPIGPLNAAAFNRVVAGIQPKGMTPLSAAIIRAAKALKYSEEKATVILVSDGRETCHADPCKTAAELKKSGVDFTAHVIGFDVSDKEGQRQLRCIADNTGGRFFTASNATDLKQALTTAVKQVEQAKALNGPAGTWYTNYGGMQISDKGDNHFDASYGNDNGRMFLKRDGKHMSGYWIEDSSDQACAEKRDGSLYWGRMELQFNEAYDSFSGWWSYCDKATRDGEWTGSRK